MNTRKTQYLRGLNVDLDSLPQTIESVSGGINGGCNLYIGAISGESGSSYITVKNISGDEVTFRSPIQGTIIPFSVVEIVDAVGVNKLVALW